MTSRTFADSLRETRRLTLLRILAEQRGYFANSSILHAGLMHLGVQSDRDDVLTDLAWLRDQGLVSLSEAIPGLDVATLTTRGNSVAHGHTLVPGVQRPGAPAPSRLPGHWSQRRIWRWGCCVPRWWRG